MILCLVFSTNYDLSQGIDIIIIYYCRNNVRCSIQNNNLETQFLQDSHNICRATQYQQEAHAIFLNAATFVLSLSKCKHGRDQTFFLICILTQAINKSALQQLEYQRGRRCYQKKRQSKHAIAEIFRSPSWCLFCLFLFILYFKNCENSLKYDISCFLPVTVKELIDIYDIVYIYLPKVDSDLHYFNNHLCN